MDEEMVEQLQALPPAQRLKALSREIFRIAAEIEELSKEVDDE